MLRKIGFECVLLTNLYVNCAISHSMLHIYKKREKVGIHDKCNLTSKSLMILPLSVAPACFYVTPPFS